MTMTDKHIEAAKLAVARANTVCRGVQDRLDDVRAVFKEDKSPVTVADFASQAVVALTLEAELGEVHMVGEEDAAELREQLASGNSALVDAVVEAIGTVMDGVTAERALNAIDLGNTDPIVEKRHDYWTLDPIDGTKGFLRNGQYAVALAWIDRGTPTLGVMGCPNLPIDQSVGTHVRDAVGSLYVATAGGGLYELPGNEPGAGGVKIVRPHREDHEPIRMCESVESGHTSHDDSERILETLGEAAEPVRLDSQAKYAVVARGQADLYLRLPRKPKPGGEHYVEKIWDHAAGALVAEEAGCAVTDVNGHDLDFSHGKTLENNRGIVVGPPALHGGAIGAIESLNIYRGQ